MADLKRLKLILILLIFFNLSVNAQINKIIIDTSVTFQEIESFTASDAWSTNFVGKYWDEKQKNQIAKYLFSQNFDINGNPEGIGLSLWRVNLGAGTLEQDDADILPYHRRAESYMTKDGKSYDWKKCSGQQYFMQKAKEYGCNNFLLFSNSPLVQYTKNGKGWSAADNEANIKPDSYGRYASYLADVASHFINEKKWNISYISPINEPQVRWISPRQEGSPWKNSEMKKMFIELDKALYNKNLNTVKILVGESSALNNLYASSPSLTERFTESEAPHKQISTFFDPESKNYIGDLKSIPAVISADSYHSHKTNHILKETREKVKKECEKYGLSFYQSEWCLLPDSKLPMDGFSSDWTADNFADIQTALLLGRLVYGDLVYAGAKSWGYWKGMEINGNHALISLFPDNNNLMDGGFVSTNKLLWALGNYSFFIRPGYIRISLQGAEDPDTLVASAYMSPDHSRIIAVFVNSSFDNMQINISLLNKLNKKVKNISYYRTDERTDLANIHIPGKFSKKKEFIIPSRSLVTMVFDL